MHRLSHLVNKIRARLPRGAEHLLYLPLGTVLSMVLQLVVLAIQESFNWKNLLPTKAAKNVESNGVGKHFCNNLVAVEVFNN